MKFEYKREEITVEAYGKVYPIPTKTIALVDGINEINKRLANCKTAAESMAVTIDGIAIFIGEDEANRIYPADKRNELDTDEISAFWFLLNRLSNKATEEVIAKYAPNPKIIKK